MVASIEGQAEAARTRGREKAAEEVSLRRLLPLAGFEISRV
jgi:hypothetical protein